MEAISIAKALAGKTGQRLDPNQELIGQGLANMIGAIGKGLSCFRLIFPFGRQLPVRGCHGFFKRFYKHGGLDRASVFYPTALSSAAVGTGGRNHDGGYRSDQRFRISFMPIRPKNMTVLFPSYLLSPHWPLPLIWTKAL